MATTINVSPMTRVEGHLDIEATVETVGGVQQVIDAKAAGQMFRGFERILAGRETPSWQKKLYKLRRLALMLGHGQVAYVLRGLLRHARGQGGEMY